MDGVPVGCDVEENHGERKDDASDDGTHPADVAVCAGEGEDEEGHWHDAGNL